MYYIGIDPGLTGAIAILNSEGHVRQVYDMPVCPRPSGKGNMVNNFELGEILEVVDSSGGCLCNVMVEDVHAMPGQGVTSVFSFGRSLGVVEGVFWNAGRFDYVRPQKWKKHFELLKSEKDAARELAIELFPDAAVYLQRKKDIGRADALLIARYVFDMFSGVIDSDRWRRVL